MKLDILAIGAHPDDVELGVGATIAKEIKAGKKVGILDLTKGELGTRGSAEIRRIEAMKSMEILGVSVRENLNLEDGFFANTKENQLKILKIIRKYKPEIVFINAIDDRHPDHERASKLASTSCFLSGLLKIKTKYDGELQKEWRPKHVYSYIQWKPIKPDFVVDVSEFIDDKIHALKQYKSQFFDPHSKEPKTLISNEHFLLGVKFNAAELGRLSGVEYAEGFKVEKYPAIASIFDFV